MPKEVRLATAATAPPSTTPFALGKTATESLVLGKTATASHTLGKKTTISVELPYTATDSNNSADSEIDAVDKSEVHGNEKAAEEHPNDMTTENFTYRVKEVTDRNDALITLPLTVLFLIVFVGNVVGHLRIQERQLLEKSMEEYVNGRDPRETADENVDDIDSWWEWVEGPGTRGPFEKVLSSSTGHPLCRLASRNMLLGDVRIKYKKFDGSTSELWLLKSSPAREVLARNATLYWEAAQAAATHYKKNGWSSSDIEYLYLGFSTYNEYHRMLAVTLVTLPLRRSGHTHSRINTDAYSIEPYDTYNVMVFDAIYALLAVKILFMESKQMLCVARGGCGELYDYFDFWNIVDWLNILLSLAIMATWVLIVMSMRQDFFKTLVDDKYKLKLDVMQMTASDLDDLDAALRQLQSLFLLLQIVATINTATLLLKFLKAFQANVRLSVATETLKASFTDVMHFLVTFLTVYLPFCLIGHILFGNDVSAFASIGASLNAGFYALMGEFGFYVDATQGMLVASTLPSGTPMILLVTWYFTYMFLMTLVMLNMLMAVVLEHYMAETETMREALENPAIWRQFKEYWRYRRQTKKHISLETLRLGLEDDDEPAHTEPCVSEESLKRAWPNMSDEQVQWLLHWLKTHLDKKAEHGKNPLDHALAMVTENRGIMEGNQDQINVLLGVVRENRKRLQDVTRKSRSVQSTRMTNHSEPQTVGFAGELDSFRTCVEDIAKTVSKVRRDLERTAKRVENINLAVPLELKRYKPPVGSKEAPPVTNTAAMGAKGLPPVKTAPVNSVMEDSIEVSMFGPTSTIASTSATKSSDTVASRAAAMKAKTAEAPSSVPARGKGRLQNFKTAPAARAKDYDSEHEFTPAKASDLEKSSVNSMRKKEKKEKKERRLRNKHHSE